LRINGCARRHARIVDSILSAAQHRAKSKAARRLTPPAPVASVISMNLPEDEQSFLRDLVKTSRQKIHHVEWIDRDGTRRRTVMSGTEASRLGEIARQLKTSPGEVLRQAAHIPVPK